MGKLINLPPVPDYVLDALARLCAEGKGANLYAHRATVNALVDVDMNAAIWLKQHWFRHADALYALAKYKQEHA